MNVAGILKELKLYRDNNLKAYTEGILFIAARSIIGTTKNTAGIFY